MSIVDGDWLPATDSLCTIRYDSDIELRTLRKIEGWGPSLYGAYNPGERVRVDSNGKNGN